MILQGRPTGYKYAMLSQSPSKHAQVLQLWQSEKGRELTTFFSLLSGPDKKKILNWSTKSPEGFRLSDSKGAGKTDLFASLDVPEKVALLQRFLNDIDEDTMFPQLRHYNGFMEELTLKPIAVRLEELLNATAEYTTKTVVKFAPDCMNAHDEVAALKPGEVLLLENIRLLWPDGLHPWVITSSVMRLLLHIAIRLLSWEFPGCSATVAAAI
jgi:phosphoglycerate kinase